MLPTIFKKTLLASGLLLVAASSHAGFISSWSGQASGVETFDNFTANPPDSPNVFRNLDPTLSGFIAPNVQNGPITFTSGVGLTKPNPNQKMTLFKYGAFEINDYQMRIGNFNVGGIGFDLGANGELGVDGNDDPINNLPLFGNSSNTGYMALTGAEFDRSQSVGNSGSTGFYTGTVTVRFELPENVSRVGAYVTGNDTMNTDTAEVENNQFSVAVFDENGEEIGRKDDNETVALNEWQNNFVGWDDAGGNIRFVEFTGQTIVLDQLLFAVNSAIVSLPSAFWLMLTGLIFLRRKLSNIS